MKMMGGTSSHVHITAKPGDDVMKIAMTMMTTMLTKMMTMTIKT